MPSSKTGNKIEKIEFKNNQFNILIDGKKILLSPSAYSDFYLYEGKVLTDEELKSIKKASSLSPLKDYATRLCSQRLYTEKEISKKLTAKGAKKDEVKSILILLKEAGLINDELYAKEYAEAARETKGYGKNKIALDLRQKGINEQIIANLPFEASNELENAKKTILVSKKKLESLPEAKRKQKALTMLMQRGFDHDIAIEAMDAMNDFDDSISKANLTVEFNKAKAKFSKKYKNYELKQKLTRYMLSKGYDYQDLSDLDFEEDF